MITDKVAEFVYESASRLFSTGRVACFLTACLLISDKAFSIFTLSFWQSSIADAGAILAGIVLDPPLYLALLAAATAFIVAPLMSKYSSLKILSNEIKRAQRAMDRINQDVSELNETVIRASLRSLQKKAAEGQQELERLRQLNEALIFSNIAAIAFAWSSEIFTYYYAILFASPLLIYFSTQEILSSYLKNIYFYKRAVEQLDT